MAAVALGRGSQLIVTGSTEWLVRGHDVRTGKPRFVRNGHRKVVHAVACSPTADVFASGADDGSLFLWRGKDGKWLRTFQKTGSQIWAAQFSPNGRILWTAAQDGAVRGYRVRDGKQIVRLPLTTSPLYSLDVHGGLLAAGAGDGSLRILDVRTRKTTHTIKGHDQTLYALKFHPTGRWLATGSADWKVRLWDVSTGKSVGSNEFDFGVYALSWAPDGKRLAVGCAGGSIIVLGTPAPTPADSPTVTK